MVRSWPLTTADLEQWYQVQNLAGVCGGLANSKTPIHECFLYYANLHRFRRLGTSRWGRQNTGIMFMKGF